MAIPALLAKEGGRARDDAREREEESYFGRARTSMVGRAKMGFRERREDCALDLFIVQDGGPYGPWAITDRRGLAASLIYQPGHALARRERPDQHAAANAAASRARCRPTASSSR